MQQKDLCISILEFKGQKLKTQYFTIIIYVFLYQNLKLEQFNQIKELRRNLCISILEKNTEERD